MADTWIAKAVKRRGFSETYLAATDAAIAAAELPATARGLVQHLRGLAKQLDGLDEHGRRPDGRVDNTSAKFYLETSKALGLTLVGAAEPAPRRPKSAPVPDGPPKLTAVDGGGDEEVSDGDAKLREFMDTIRRSRRGGGSA